MNILSFSRGLGLVPVLALATSACTDPNLITPVSSSTTTSTTYVQPQQTPVADTRPAATSLNMSIASSNDETLTNSQLRKLISGRTIYSQNLDNPSKTQVGTFTTDGNMSVSTGGNNISGKWTIEGGRVCYLIDGSRFCSKVQRSAKNYKGAPIYYFRRDSGDPTVVITGFS